MKILNAARIWAWDEYTINHESVSSIELMERAAAACVQWITGYGPEMSDVVVFCGKGNNGGDGLAIARMLAADGRTVEVYIIDGSGPGSDDFKTNLKRLYELPRVSIRYLTDKKNLPELKSSMLLIDAIFGSGLNRPASGIAADVIDHINESGRTIISIDMPSGMFADISSAGNDIVRANHTLTFQCIKRGLLLPGNGPFTGELHVLNIGLHMGYMDSVVADEHVIDEALIRKIYKPRKRFAHKGDFGHSLIIAGSYGKMGAAVLAARGCLHSGTGLLSVHVPSAAYVVMQTAVPEAMVFTDENSSCISDITTDINSFRAIGIGPGIGTQKDTRNAVRDLLEKTERPMVIDADALNILAAEPALLNRLPKNSILTPHPKEFMRLFGESDNVDDQPDIASRKAMELGLVIIVKGHHSYVALPGEHRGARGFFNNTGNPGMATAGSGDVLTGILTALLAQGYEPWDAAILGVYLHGLAGDLAALALSEESLSAGDIINFLPPAFQRLSRPIS